MSLATTFEDKVRIINDIYTKMAPDEKRIMLRTMIKDDMKMFFETIWDEQKFLEKETGIDGVESITECTNTSEKAWADGEEITNEDVGMEINLAGRRFTKEAENAFYLDEKRREKLGNDRYDGYLGYINSSADIPQENEETTLEPGEFVKEKEVK